jgi:hypothetical protein
MIASERTGSAAQQLGASCFCSMRQEYLLIRFLSEAGPNILLALEFHGW